MVVGLGNPGPEYEASRHNVGFRVVDALAVRAGAGFTRRRYRSLSARGSLHGVRVLFVKPLTFMNDSGTTVLAWQQAVGIDPARIIVIHDDLDLQTSRLRIKSGGGHGGHKGVRSVMEALGTGAFLRVKVGIGRPRPGHDPVEHVLGLFEKPEREEIDQAVGQAADAVEALMREGPEAAMNRYNVRGTARRTHVDSQGGEGGEHV